MLTFRPTKRGGVGVLEFFQDDFASAPAFSVTLRAHITHFDTFGEK